jgi:hypothetical protein
VEGKGEFEDEGAGDQVTNIMMSHQSLGLNLQTNQLERFERSEGFVMYARPLQLARLDKASRSCHSRQYGVGGADLGLSATHHDSSCSQSVELNIEYRVPSTL